MQKLRLLAACAALWTAGAGAALAWNSPAPDVVLYSLPALERPMQDIAARYTAARHIPVHLFVAPPAGLIGLITHRARADVLIAGDTTLQDLSAAKLILPDSVVPIGKDGFVLVASTGAVLPPDAKPADLVADHTTALTDDTTAAGFDGAAILHAALPDASPHTIGEPDTRTLLVLVRHNAKLLGVVASTEAHAPGIAQAAVLAAPPTQIAVGLTKNGQSANSADLLAFIHGQEGRAVLQTYGLEPAP